MNNKTMTFGGGYRQIAGGVSPYARASLQTLAGLASGSGPFFRMTFGGGYRQIAGGVTTMHDAYLAAKAEIHTFQPIPRGGQAS